MKPQLETFALPCRASNIRGRLKHTYLTNKVCLKALPEDLLESLLYKEKGVPQHQLIHEQVHVLLEIMGSAEQGFSPAQLVDQLPSFEQWSPEERSRLKERVQQQFEDEFQLAQRKSELAGIARQFLGEMDAFVSQPSGKAGMGMVQQRARALICELERLPKGVWLWPTEANYTMKG